MMESYKSINFHLLQLLYTKIDNLTCYLRVLQMMSFAIFFQTLFLFLSLDERPRLTFIRKWRVKVMVKKYFVLLHHPTFSCFSLLHAHDEFNYTYYYFNLRFKGETAVSVEVRRLKEGLGYSIFENYNVKVFIE